MVQILSKQTFGDQWLHMLKRVRGNGMTLSLYSLLHQNYNPAMTLYVASASTEIVVDCLKDVNP